MKFFNLSKFYVLNILAYFSLVANFVYVFYAIYLFKFKNCSGLLAEFEPLVYTGIYYFYCALIIVVLFLFIFIEFMLRKTGKIKTYQTVISVISYTMMPITFFAVKYTIVPEVAFLCLLLSKVIEQIARIIVSKKKLNISLRQYFVHVVMPVVLVFTLSMILSFTLKNFMDEDLVSSILLILISVVTVISFVYILGLSKEERVFVNVKIQQIRVKLFK